MLVSPKASWPATRCGRSPTPGSGGLRLSELIGLDVGSFGGRAGERRIHVVATGAGERTVPVEEPLPRVIERYMATRRERFPALTLTPKAPLFVDRRGDRLKRGGAHYPVERSYRAAGLADRVPAGAMVHALRHTYATRLAEDGASTNEIQVLLGHRSPGASQGYIDARADRTDRSGRAAGGRGARRPAARNPDLGATGELRCDR